MVIEPKQGKLASSQFDLGYTKRFCVPEVTSVFFSSCDSVVGDSLEFNQANCVSLGVWLGKRNCSACSAGESGYFSWRGGSLMGFLEFRQDPGLYYRIMAGMSIQKWSLFSEARIPGEVWRTRQERKLGLAGQYGPSGSQVGDQVSFSSWHSDIGIPINFHEDSGIITFWSIEINVPLEVSTDVKTLSRRGRHLGPSLSSPQGIHASLYLVRWNTSLDSSHCRENRPSFESGHLSTHSSWCSKLRVPVTYLLLREWYSWGACGKLAYLFNKILGIHSLLEMIWCPWSFPRVPVLKLVFLYIWDGYHKGIYCSCLK